MHHIVTSFFSLRDNERQRGFTIIEVMIVLVIAAVILLIVFLAVPALQRNSRNTQRRADVGRLSTAFLEYIQTNPIPTQSHTDPGNIAIASELKNDAATTTFDSVVITGNFAKVTAASSSSNSRALFKTRSACNAASDNVDENESNGRVALIYWIETSGGYTQHCTQVR